MKQKKSEAVLTLAGHLEELRVRLLRSLLAAALAACGMYFFSDPVIGWLARPAGGFVFTMPEEAFLAKLKVAFFGGLFLSSPYWIFETWRFIAAGLKDREKKAAFFYGPVSFGFFFAGSAFGCFVIAPLATRFLLGFSGEFMRPMITVSHYISFAGALTLAFGIVFLLPVACVFLSRIGVVTPRFLAGHRRHAIVIIFILAAVLTPPDIVSQCLMAVPLAVLYELGILLAGIAGSKTGKR